MTCIIVDTQTRLVGLDSANTDSAGFQWRTDKFEKLKDGRIFLGSGHNLTIRLAKKWAEAKFKEPVPETLFNLILDHNEDSNYSFSCLILDPDSDVVLMLDEELVPMEVQGRYHAVGSGAAYAIGAARAGATMGDAVAIAVEYDQYCSEPVRVIGY